MKNIWIFNHYIVPPSVELGHRHNKFAKYLAKDGYNVNLFFSSARHNSNINLIKDDRRYSIEETNQGNYIAIKTRSYKENGKQRVLNMLDFFFGLFSVTKEIEKKTGKPDIIYASSVHPLTCIAGILIAKRYKIKCIVEIRDLWPLTLVEMGALKPNSIITKLLYEGEKWIYKKADSIIFTMEGGKDYIKEMGWNNKIDVSKIYHINNGVDLDVFNEQMKKYVYCDTDLDDANIFKIIYTGSIGQANAVNYIVKSSKIIKEKGYGKIKYIIFGDGLKRKELEKYCIDNKLDNVVFKGKVDKSYIPSILSKGNLNIFTGQNIDLYKYGLSLNKMFDYFASEKPALSNIKCGYDILKKYHSGITVESGSAEALAEGILKFYHMSKEEYNEYCRNAKRAAQDYDFKNLTNTLEEVINNTVEGEHEYSIDKSKKTI